MDFSNTTVTVTLTGEEWFALTAKLAGHALSDKGRRILQNAQESLAAQLGRAADAIKAEVVS